MSFEQTSSYIENLSGQEKITLDEMLDLLLCVTQDVLVHNKDADVRDLPVSNQLLLMKKEYSLIQMLVLVDRENRCGVAEFGKGFQERYQNYIEEIEQMESELLEKITFAEEKEAELQRKNDKLMEERGHLLTVEEDCEKLHKQIEKLSDSYLDKLAEEKVKLEEELKQREEKRDELQAELTAMINVCSSIRNDTFLQEALYQTSKEEKGFSVKSHPDYAVAAKEINDSQKLQEWFEEMDQRINGLLNVYKMMLQKAVQKSEALTEEVE